MWPVWETLPVLQDQPNVDPYVRPGQVECEVTQLRARNNQMGLGFPVTESRK
jgi:hypothetical protein